jgi:hypothetical protein
MYQTQTQNIGLLKCLQKKKLLHGFNLRVIEGPLRLVLLSLGRLGMSVKKLCVLVYLDRECEMGRTCGTYGGEERCIQGFSGET